MYSMLYTTVGSKEEAVRISSELLERKLVACANIFPISSMYWWEDKIQNEDELAIIFKTRTSLLRDAMASIKKIHSYKVPCLMCYEYVLGDKAYLKWIDDSTEEGQA